MAVALHLYEDGLCEGCGQPRSTSQSDAMVGAYEVHDQIVCHGCAAVDEHRAGMANKQVMPGQKSRVAVRPEAV